MAKIQKRSRKRATKELWLEMLAAQPEVLKKAQRVAYKVARKAQKQAELKTKALSQGQRGKPKEKEVPLRPAPNKNTPKAPGDPT